MIFGYSSCIAYRDKDNEIASYLFMPMAGKVYANFCKRLHKVVAAGVSAQLVFVEMGCHLQVEVEHGEDGEAGTEEVGLVEGADFRNVAAGEHTDADAYIPRGEVGGGGSAALAVGCQIDEHGVVGRKHDAETDAKQQGYAEEDHGAGCLAPLDDMDAAREQEEADHHDVEAEADELGGLALVYQAAGEESRHSHAYGHEGEEETRGGLQAYLTGIHGYVVGGHAIGNGEQQQADTGGDAFQQNEAV